MNRSRILYMTRGTLSGDNYTGTISRYCNRIHTERVIFQPHIGPLGFDVGSEVFKKGGYVPRKVLTSPFVFQMNWCQLCINTAEKDAHPQVLRLNQLKPLPYIPTHEVTKHRTERMNEGEFLAAVGSLPENDDLERVNCTMAGEMSHTSCGLCRHGYPKFLPCYYCEGDLA